MRTTSPAVVSCVALLLAWGCGGNVAVDVSPTSSTASVSSGGAGGGAAVTGGSDTGGSGGALTCDFACGGPVGLCGCAGPCSDGKMRAIGCGGGASGFQCDCVVDGETVGSCSSPTLACHLPGSCCEPIFGG